MDQNVVARAAAIATEKSAATGVSIRVLKGVDEQNLARRIFDEVWPTDEGIQITANLLQAMVHNGTYVSGVFVEGEIVGAVFAFPGVDEHRHLHLHSHMAAVKERFRDRSIGSTLKWHQRAWALEHGYEVITWTFDPLVRRNARLNLVKLGVQAFEYFPNFYGELPDALNAGDPTDRIIARWDLLSESTLAAASSRNLEKRADGIPVALSNIDGRPIRHEIDPSQPQVLCYLPNDIIEIRSQDNALALEWRLALRAELHPRLESDWHISGFTQDGAYLVTNQANSQTEERAK
ncbi:MAG TPA: GNAT family N-acetyltransferase [Candidatus Paceibacterota bacterium]|nr:GNAT family N-acetyltransferase [Candidatus Paceibacterota bacterium]